MFCGTIGVMRVIILFLILLVALGVAYMLVPTEQMQMKAKNTIQQVQALETSLDFEDIADEFGALFEKQKERLTKTAEPEDVTDGDYGVACTQEAKQCPDGRFVGRIGPDCAFAPCPGEEESTEVQGEEGGSAVLVR